MVPEGKHDLAKLQKKVQKLSCRHSQRPYGSIRTRTSSPLLSSRYQLGFHCTVFGLPDTKALRALSYTTTHVFCCHSRGIERATLFEEAVERLREEGMTDVFVALQQASLLFQGHQQKGEDRMMMLRRAVQAIGPTAGHSNHHHTIAMIPGVSDSPQQFMSAVSPRQYHAQQGDNSPLAALLHSNTDIAHRPLRDSAGGGGGTACRHREGRCKSRHTEQPCTATGDKASERFENPLPSNQDRTRSPHCPCELRPSLPLHAQAALVSRSAPSRSPRLSGGAAAAVLARVGRGHRTAGGR